MNPDEAQPDSSTQEDGLTHSQRIEKLFLEHNGALLRFLTARTGSAQDARDVAQEAYVKLLSLDQPETVGYLRAYLYSTASNLVKNRLKHHHRRERADPLLFFDFQEDQGGPSPESASAASQRLAIVAAAIDELPPICRRAFVMRKFDGLDLEHIAARLNLNVRSIKRYMARAMEHLDRRLTEAAAPKKDVK